MSDRHYCLYLSDILESLEAIEEYTAGINFEFFVADRKTYSATLREFIVIGEAIAKIPDDLRSMADKVTWRLIKDFRNFIVHDYFGIDPRIVWDAVCHEIAPLKQDILRLHREHCGQL